MWRENCKAELVKRGKITLFSFWNVMLVPVSSLVLPSFRFVITKTSWFKVSRKIHKNHRCPNYCSASLNIPHILSKQCTLKRDRRFLFSEISWLCGLARTRGFYYISFEPNHILVCRHSSFSQSDCRMDKLLIVFKSSPKLGRPTSETSEREEQERTTWFRKSISNR